MEVRRKTDQLLKYNIIHIFSERYRRALQPVGNILKNINIMLHYCSTIPRSNCTNITLQRLVILPESEKIIKESHKLYEQNRFYDT